MVSQDTGKSTRCSKVFSYQHEENIKSLHYWPFVTSAFSSRKTVMQKICPYHNPGVILLDRALQISKIGSQLIMVILQLPSCQYYQILEEIRILCFCLKNWQTLGGRFNMNISSYHHNGISFTGETSSLFWIRAQRVKPTLGIIRWTWTHVNQNVPWLISLWSQFQVDAGTKHRQVHYISSFYKQFLRA